MFGFLLFFLSTVSIISSSPLPSPQPFTGMEMMTAGSMMAAGNLMGVAFLAKGDTFFKRTLILNICTIFINR